MNLRKDHYRGKASWSGARRASGRQPLRSTRFASRRAPRGSPRGDPGRGAGFPFALTPPRFYTVAASGHRAPSARRGRVGGGAPRRELPGRAGAAGPRRRGWGRVRATPRARARRFPPLARLRLAPSPVEGEKKSERGVPSRVCGEAEKVRHPSRAGLRSSPARPPLSRPAPVRRRSAFPSPGLAARAPSLLPGAAPGY